MNEYSWITPKISILNLCAKEIVATKRFFREQCQNIEKTFAIIHLFSCKHKL